VTAVVKTKKKARPEGMFKAFADLTRLRILSLLINGELCVCDIVSAMKLSQPLISRHLAYLRKNGLVEARKEKLWMHYQLAPAKDALHKSLLDCLRCCFEAVPELKLDAQRCKGCCRPGECC
jgi:ArsR family transcriptional regulator